MHFGERRREPRSVRPLYDQMDRKTAHYRRVLAIINEEPDLLEIFRGKIRALHAAYRSSIGLTRARIACIRLAVSTHPPRPGDHIKLLQSHGRTAKANAPPPFGDPVQLAVAA